MKYHAKTVACGFMALYLLAGCGSGGTGENSALEGEGTPVLGEVSPESEPAPDMSLSELVENGNTDC